MIGVIGVIPLTQGTDWNWYKLTEVRWLAFPGVTAIQVPNRTRDKSFQDVPVFFLARCLTPGSMLQE
jgi:hypothetical protein